MLLFSLEPFDFLQVLATFSISFNSSVFRSVGDSLDLVPIAAFHGRGNVQVTSRKVIFYVGEGF